MDGGRWFKNIYKNLIMAWPLIIMGAVALAGSIYQGINAKKQRDKLQAGNDALGLYQANPIAAQQYGLAQSLYGGRMAGATSAEQNILANRANTMASAERNATDSSQVLALAGQSQEMSDIAVNNLGQLEAQDKTNRYGLLQSAAGLAINESDKVRADAIRKYMQDAAIEGVYRANMNNAVGTFVNGVGMGLGSMAGGSGGSYGGYSGSTGSTAPWSNGIKNPYN